MAIVAMKKVRAFVPIKYRREALQKIYALGNVEISPVSKEQLISEFESLQKRAESTNAERHKNEIKQALEILSHHVERGKKALGGKQTVTEKELFDEKDMDKALSIAHEIKRLQSRMDALSDDGRRLKSEMEYLAFWEKLDVPLELCETARTEIVKGTLPMGADIDRLEEKLEEIKGAALIVIEKGKEQTACLLICHKKSLDKAMETVRKAGFSREDFSGFKGTASENIEKCRKKLSENEMERKSCIDEIKKTGNVYDLLEKACDAYSIEQTRDELLSGIVYTKRTAALSGYVAAEDAAALESVLDRYSAVYSITDPEEGDFPPTVLKSKGIAQCMNPVTEMYGMPKYDSKIDPNIPQFPFYVVFFGAIMADFVYGLIITLGCIAGLKILKPKKNSSMYNLLKLFAFGGIATMFFGILTGSYLGDLVTVFSSTFLGKEITVPPLWFSPIEEPMKMLIFSMVLGGVQIVTGMGVAAVRMIKNGKIWDAVFDVGSWYVIFIGLGLMGLGFEKWYYVSLFGVAVLLLTGGRHKKGIFGKLTGGLGSLYNVTGYVSDLLSYSRIMALGLSGAVVGSVVNKMGAMGGGGVFGALLLIFAVVIGHTFNLAISVLGAYVHTSRLQYIEFFGRFYEDGGRIMKPLENKTKYVNIKE